MTDTQTEQAAVRVGIVMGSDSDWPVMQPAGEILTELGVAWEADVVSAHRMPTEMIAWGQQAHTRGLSVVIAGAGGAAHLPGMLASVTPLPVIGVPVPLKYLDGKELRPGRKVGHVNAYGDDLADCLERARHAAAWFVGDLGDTSE